MEPPMFGYFSTLVNGFLWLLRGFLVSILLGPLHMWHVHCDFPHAMFSLRVWLLVSITYVVYNEKNLHRINLQQHLAIQCMGMMRTSTSFYFLFLRRQTSLSLYILSDQLFCKTGASSQKPTSARRKQA